MGQNTKNIIEIQEPYIFFSKDGPFEKAAEESLLVANLYKDALNETDLKWLIKGFYQAEKMAGYAISHAMSQLPKKYHSGLIEQGKDEERHIKIFQEWLIEPSDLFEPSLKTRQDVQWLVLLLVNELTGFCQFRLLSNLLNNQNSREIVDIIAKDEKIHVERLLSWLYPLWQTKTMAPVFQFITRFRLDLMGRMYQFFPRESLFPLRKALIDVIDPLIASLPSPAPN